MSGPPRKPTAWRRMEGNRGKKAWNHAEPVPLEGVPDCPEHLSNEARAEWHRLVETLVGMGVITIVDRAVLASYFQAYGRWVEAEEKLRETPLLIKTPLRAVLAARLCCGSVAHLHGGTWLRQTLRHLPDMLCQCAELSKRALCALHGLGAEHR